MYTRSVLVALALAASLPLAACIEDNSAPNRRGIERLPLGGNPGEVDRANKRALEAPSRDLPTGAGKEFPGQSRGSSPESPSVVTLADVGNPKQPYHTQDDGTRALESTNPIAVPGRPIAVPGTGMTIEADWGTTPPMTTYPHRPWPDQQTSYLSGETKHNPVYYQSALVQPYPPNDAMGAVAPSSARGLGTTGMVMRPGVLTGPLAPTPAVSTPATGTNPAATPNFSAAGTSPTSTGEYNLASVGADLLDIPYFVAQTVALPVMMVIQPPLIQVTSAPGLLLASPVYLGHLPPAGPVVPSPFPGAIRWTYDFAVSESTTAPATFPTVTVPPPTTAP